MSDSDSDIPSPPPKRNSAGVKSENDVSKLQARVTELETELSTLQQQLTKYKTENDSYQSEIEKLKAEIEALKNEQQQVKKELEESKAELIATKESALVASKTDGAAPEQQSQGVAVASAEKGDGAQAQEQENDEEVEKLRSEVEELKQTIRRQEQLIIQAASPLISTMSSPQPTTSVTLADKRKPGEVTLKMRKNRQEKLLAVRAQITAWLNKILSPDPPLVNETIMERLATGIIPCNLAIIVDDSAIPILGRVHLKASAYSILAHENVHSFLRVCYAWGLKKIECFSPEDLLSGNVRNRNERLVVETLLSLAKVVYLKFGIEPPYMIKAELDIDEADDANSKHQTTMEDAEHEKLLSAIRAYCQLHNIADIPVGTEKKGQFEFSDGTLSHIRMFEIDPDNADGTERDAATVMTAVQNGELVLLVRHNNNWEELHKFLHEHSGGKKIDMGQVQLAAISAHTADASQGSLTDQTAAKVEVVEAPVVEIVDVMVDTYGSANYEEEDEDDEDEEELERLRQEARAEEERARLAAQQAEMELAARKAALLAQQEAEEEFQRQKQKNKFANSYLTDADLRGDTGEFLNKVRSGMGKGDFDPEAMDPEKANFSAVINTSDYKRFKDITMSEIQIMTNDDLERLAEYTAKQEFFYLTALAVKMTHELSYSSAFQVVTNQELWRRAIEQNIPFHRFYPFITNEITKSYLEQAASEKQGGAKDGVNLRSHRELMIANIKERQKGKR